MAAPTGAMAVANWFLERAKADQDANVPPVDQLKLYKLVYYAHAWHLANYGEPLFDEDIQAWQHGPVVSDLYREFNDFGAKPIGRMGARLVLNEQGLPEVETPRCPGELNEFLEAVWQSHRLSTGIALSNATHDPGEPWTIVKQQYDLVDKPIIPNEIIESVFRAKLPAEAAT